MVELHVWGSSFCSGNPDSLSLAPSHALEVWSSWDAHKLAPAPAPEEAEEADPETSSLLGLGTVVFVFWVQASLQQMCAWYPPPPEKEKRVSHVSIFNNSKPKTSGVMSTSESSRGPY